VSHGLSIESIAWAFSATEQSNWHPLTWLSHMADCQFFGVERPGAHHVVNVAIHVINVSLMFLLFRQMTGALWPPLFVASIFALHPLHVESVAWLSERKDVLSTMFWLLCLMSYVTYARCQSATWYFLVIVLLALGLMSKPMLVTTPMLLLLLDFWPLERISAGDQFWRSARRLIAEKVPLMMLVVISSLVTYVVQRQGESAHFIHPLWHRLATVVMAYTS